MDGLNYGTYYFFRTLAKERPELHAFVHGIVRVVDVLGSVVVVGSVALLLIGALAWQRRWHAALIVASSIIGGLAVIEGLNQAIGIERPEDMDVTYDLVDLGPAFASRAAFLSCLVYGLAALSLAEVLSGRAGRLLLFAVCLGLVLAIGFSQLYLRIEYLTGLLAGWAWGAFLLILCWRLIASAAASAR